MPTTIFPNLPAASSTVWVARQPGTGRFNRSHTGRSTPSLVNEVDRAPAIEIDEVEIPRAFFPDDLSGRNKQGGLAARKLHTKDGLRRVSSYEGPLFF